MKHREPEKCCAKKTPDDSEATVTHQIQYDGGPNTLGGTKATGLTVSYEVKTASGPLGRQLTLAQARALREALEWVATQARPTRRPDDIEGDYGEEEPRAA